MYSNGNNKIFEAVVTIIQNLVMLVLTGKPKSPEVSGNVFKAYYRLASFEKIIMVFGMERMAKKTTPGMMVIDSTSNRKPSSF